MKSPVKIGENRILGNISSSSIRNLLPRSIYSKQKSIRNPETRSSRFNDENAPISFDPNIQTDDHHDDLQNKKKSPQKVFPFATQIPQSVNTEELTQAQQSASTCSEGKENIKFEARNVLSTRSHSTINEISEEEDPLGDQIRELKDELIRTKSDGYNPDGYFKRESLSQLRMSINKSLVMSCANKDDDEKEPMDAGDDDDDDDVMELSKHIEKFHNSCDVDDLRESLQSSFASASCCEAESMSEDESCSGDLEKSKHGIHKECVLPEPTLSESPKIRSVRKSVAPSTKFMASPRSVSESSNTGNTKVEDFGPSISKKLLSPTDSLAASLQRGLQIIDCHQRNSLSNRSSASFSFGRLSLKPCDEADNLSASVKLLKEDRQSVGASILLCLSCRQKLDQAVEGGYKATEEVYADEKDLKNICKEQANKIEQLNSLLDQYKNNTVQESSKLMKINYGEDETEVVQETTYGANQHSEESHKINIDLNEKEALLKEIAELKSKLQPAKSTDNLRSSLLLRSFQMRKSTDFTKSPENNEDLEKERERWTEMESEWISLTDDLRMDIDNHRRHAEDLEIELKQEKMATEELNDALARAMLGHSRFIEQYTELQEKYDELAERHNMMLAGMVDVKKAAAKAAMKGRHGKRFAKAFSAELTAIRAEKEKEREFLKKENKGLKTQLRDTVEAVQAAGELLVRLREAEQIVHASEERFTLLEDENEKLKNQMEKLKSKHKTEMSTMKQYLAESKLPGSALQPWFKEEEPSEQTTGVVSYDDYADDQAWRAEFGAIYQNHDHY